VSLRRLPIFVDLTGRRVLIVGGGRAAQRKLPALLDAGARITLIAPQIQAPLRALLRDHQLIERPAQIDDVTADYAFFFPLTNDAHVNRELTAAARAARVWTAGCSDADNSDFHMAAVVECGPVRLAVSSGGTSPSLARHVAQVLRDILPTHEPT
jgi:siroheme synthase-like protein